MAQLGFLGVMGARIGLIDGLLAAATATFRCNRQGLDPAGRRRLTRTVAQNGTFRSSSITLKIPSLKVVSRMCRPLLTTPFTGPIVWWFWMEDCQTWHISSYSWRKRSSSNWQRNIGRKRVNGSGSLRRPPTKLARRFAPANTRCRTWKQSFAGSQSGWFIT